MSAVARSEDQEQPLVLVNGGAVTYIGAGDLADVLEAGGATVGDPVPVANGAAVGTCPDCPHDGAA